MKRRSILPLFAVYLLMSTSFAAAQSVPRGACVVDTRGTWCFPPATGPRGGNCWCLINGTWMPGTQN